MIVLWNRINEKEVPMAERWYRKIYSFCKGIKFTREHATESWIMLSIIASFERPMKGTKICSFSIKISFCGFSLKYVADFLGVETININYRIQYLLRRKL